MCLLGAGWRVLARSSYGTLDKSISGHTGAYLYQMSVMLFLQGNAKIFWPRTSQAFKFGLYVFRKVKCGVLNASSSLFRLRGHADYWKQSRWWWGVLCDGTAGLMIWPAMPILAAQALQNMFSLESEESDWLDASAQSVDPMLGQESA